MNDTNLADKSYHNAGELENDHPVQMVYNPMGQRIAMEDITGESTDTYDSLGRLKTATNGSGKVVEYFYDEADNLAAIRYPDGGEVSYEYDKNDNITKLTDRDGRDTAYEYDPLNRLTKVVRADGSESVYTYNARNQVLEAENTCVCGFLISDYKYTYDDAGLVTKEVAKECLFASDKDYGHEGGSKDNCAHTVDNPWMNQDPEWETTVRTFTYDDNGQMVGCQESKGQFHKVTYTYKYDEAGNRTFAKKAKTFPYSYLESWQNTYTYNDDNQMVKAQVCEGNLMKDYTFAYDANGNMTAECFRRQAEVTYQYDAENRLTAVYDQQKLLMASTYDGDGNQAFQLNYNPAAVCGYGIGWGDEIYMPEHSQNEDESLTAEGLLFSYVCSDTGRAYDLTEYVNDTNREYTEVLTAYTINGGATESYSYAGNKRLSRNNIWTEARDVVPNETSYYLYDGRGSVTANTWYNGESYNPNTGLEFLRARYYNADMGRFFQEDSYLGKIAEPLTLNRYAYGKNSPMNYADPSGHKTQDGQDKELSAFVELLIALVQRGGEIPSLPQNYLLDKIDVVELVSSWISCNLLDKEIAVNPGKYGTGIMIGQGKDYTNVNGTFGPLGNISDNACGAFAVQNALTLLGYNPSFGNTLKTFNKEWKDSTLVAGKLGSNPFYVNDFLTNRGLIANYYYKDTINDRYITNINGNLSDPSNAIASGNNMIGNVDNKFDVNNHEAYISVYIWKSAAGQIGAHYQALQYDDQGKINAFNTPDGNYNNFQEYYEKADARAMLIIGYDRDPATIETL